MLIIDALKYFSVACAMVSVPAVGQPLNPNDFSTLGILNLSSGDFLIDTDNLTITDVTGGGSTLLFSGVADNQGGTADYFNGNWIPGTLGIPEIAVFTFDGIDLASTANISITGDRAIALLSHGDSQINTTLSVNAAPGGGFTFANDFTTVNNNGLTTPGEAGGAGGFDGGSYIGSGTSLLANGPGGGSFRGYSEGATEGGSFGGRGVDDTGFGKSASTTIPDDTNEPYGDLTTALQGGSGGGVLLNFSTGGINRTIGAGGGGGGAIELGANGALILESDARIEANGGLGNGYSNDFDSTGASGSGGGIRLHAGQIINRGVVEANGGGGALFSDFDDTLYNTRGFGGGGRILVNGLVDTYTIGDPIPENFLQLGISAEGGAIDPAGTNETTFVPTTAAQDGVLTFVVNNAVVRADTAYTLGQNQIASVAPGIGQTGFEFLLNQGPGTSISVRNLGSVFVDEGGFINLGEIALEGSGARIAETPDGTANPFLLNDGTVSGTGRIETLFNNRNGGQVNTVNDTLVFTRQASGEGGSEVNAINSTVTFEQGYGNAGDLNAINSTIIGDFINNGTVSLAGTNTFTGNISGSGDFTGTGTAVFTGSSAPGNSPGQVTYEGNVTYEDTHNLLIELAGSGGVAGVDFDQIVVEGLLTLDGSLTVTSLNSYTPELGESFLILAGDAVDGTFVGLNEGDIAASFGEIDFVISYTAGDGNDVALSAVPEPTSLLLVLAGLPALMRRRPTA